MPPITTIQLFDAYQRLSERVGIFESKIKELENKSQAQAEMLEAMNERLDTIDQSIKFARQSMTVVSSIVGPIVTGIFVLIIQHFFFH